MMRLKNILIEDLKRQIRELMEAVSPDDIHIIVNNIIKKYGLPPEQADTLRSIASTAAKKYPGMNAAELEKVVGNNKFVQASNQHANPKVSVAPKPPPVSNMIKSTPPAVPPGTQASPASAGKASAKPLSGWDKLKQIAKSPGAWMRTRNWNPGSPDEIPAQGKIEPASPAANNMPSLSQLSAPNAPDISTLAGNEPGAVPPEAPQGNADKPKIPGMPDLPDFVGDQDPFMLDPMPSPDKKKKKEPSADLQKEPEPPETKFDDIPQPPDDAPADLPFDAPEPDLSKGRGFAHGNPTDKLAHNWDKMIQKGGGEFPPEAAIDMPKLGAVAKGKGKKVKKTKAAPGEKPTKMEPVAAPSAEPSMPPLGALTAPEQAPIKQKKQTPAVDLPALYNAAMDTKKQYGVWKVGDLVTLGKAGHARVTGKIGNRFYLKKDDGREYVFVPFHGMYPLPLDGDEENLGDEEV
jgi:hypothetical protein